MKDVSGPAAQLPEQLRSVALCSGKTAAAVGGVSITWWNDQVRAGRAPKPVIRSNRCTRYSVESVREFWAGIAQAALSSELGGD